MVGVEVHVGTKTELPTDGESKLGWSGGNSEALPHCWPRNLAEVKTVGYLADRGYRGRLIGLAGRILGG